MSPTACPGGAFPPYGPDMNETVLTVHQTARPHGFPTAGHFTFVESALPEPAAGSALVENLYWSVDPYHRELMDDVPGGFVLGAPLEGRAIGRVIASRTPNWPRARPCSTGRAGGLTPWSLLRRSGGCPASKGYP